MDYINNIKETLSNIGHWITEEFTSPPLNGKKILIVEDADDTRDFLSLLLRNGGAKTEIAINGKDGLEKIESYEPDLVLLDLEMPVLDGFSVIKQLHARGYSKPVIAITSHNSLQDKDRCQDAGFDGYISKPFDHAHLLYVLKEHLAR